MQIYVYLAYALYTPVRQTQIFAFASGFPYICEKNIQHNQAKNEQSRFPFTRRLVGMDNTFIRCRSIAYRMHRQFVVVQIDLWRWIWHIDVRFAYHGNIRMLVHCRRRQLARL